MRRALHSLGVAVAMLGCVSTRPPPKAPALKAPESAPGEKNPLERMMEREIAEMPKQSLTASKGAVRFSSEASAPIQVEESDKLSIQIPIGASEPINCVLMGDYFRPGEMLRKVTALASKDSQMVAIHVRNVRVASGGPAAFLEAAFVHEGADKTASFGHLKVMVAPSPPTATVCYLGDIGYADTFERVALGLLGSLQVEGNVPDRTVVYLYSLGELVLGFEHRRVWSHSNGALRAETIGLMTSPISGKEISYDDSGYAEEQDPRGFLQSFTYFRNTAGSSDEATLARSGRDAYSLTGHLGGQIISETLRTADGALLVAEIARDRLVRDQLLSGKKKELSLEIYIPNVKPAALSKEKFGRGDKQDQIWTEVGGMKIQTEVDPDGTMRKGLLDSGRGPPIEVNRVFFENNLR